MKLFIVLATYNGARFVEDQIRSIQDQTIENWTLLIRDDGSNDGTVEKIRQLESVDNRIILLKDDFGNLGVTQNFARLMQAALDLGADYIAISDQDDVWCRKKLQVLLQKMRLMELGDGEGLPILIHSDLEVVDEAMRPLNCSFVNFIGIYPHTTGLGHLLCQNDVTGCACLINRKLLELALPIPQVVPMHDWWIALLAITSGKIGYVDEALVKYRQHTGNVVGAQSEISRMLKYLLEPTQHKQQVGRVISSMNQAKVLAERLGDQSLVLQKSIQYQMVNDYATLSNFSRLERLRKMAAHKISKRSTAANFIFKLIVLSLPLRSETQW